MNTSPLARRYSVVAAIAALLLFGTGSYGRAQSGNEFAQAGFAAKERRDYPRAIQLFTEALRVGNFPADQRGFLLYSRGVSLEGLGIRDRALVDLDAAIALLPSFPNSYIYRALIWTDRQEYDRAIEDLLQASRLNPSDPMVFNNLGGVYENKREFEKAIASYNQALKLSPNYADAYYNRAHAYLIQKDFDRALADYDQTIWLNPNFANAYGNRGALYLMRGDSEKAIADFDKAIQLTPRDATFWNNRANAYLTLEKYDRALSDFDQALQLDPGNVGTYLGRGRARLFAGNSEASAEDFQTAVRLRPSNPYPVIWLHIARVHRGESDEAELATNAARVNRGKWPTDLLDLYLRKSEIGEVRASASAGDPKEACEADFFIVEFQYHVRQVSEKDARELLEAIAARCRAHDVVFSGAKAELRLLAR